jgi:hypothetical protein
MSSFVLRKRFSRSSDCSYLASPFVAAPDPEIAKTQCLCLITNIVELFDANQWFGLRKMNAVEVLIDGKRVGTYVPPEGSSFAVMVGNVPRTYMRAHITAMSDAESWQWQLPDIKPGQLISFRQINALAGSGVPPQFVRPRDPREVAENRREAKKLYAKVKGEIAARKRKKA